MTAIIEKKAMNFLLNDFESDEYGFDEATSTDDCEIIIVKKLTGKRLKGELKSSETQFTQNSDIRARLVFNKKSQKTMFEKGELLIVRVFLGNTPTKVILISNKFLSEGATIEQEERYKIVGKSNFEACTHLS